MNLLAIRAAHSDELAAILGLLEEAALWLRAKGIDYWQNWIDPLPHFTDWIRGGLDGGEFHLVEQSGELIGCFRLQDDDPMFWGQRTEAAGYIHSFTVARDRVEAGTGRRVLAVIEDMCRDGGKQLLRLDCGADNKGLRKYYASCGFAEVGHTTVACEDLVLLEKTM